MPKKSIKRNKKNRHDPLGKQIIDSRRTGTFKEYRDGPGKREREREERIRQNEGKAVTDRMSKKILQQVREQQQEIQEEELRQAQDDIKNDNNGRTFSSQLGDNSDDDDDFDGDEFVFDDGDDEEIELNEEDAAALSMFMPQTMGKTRNLADMIMEKLRAKQQGLLDPQEHLQSTLDPKIVEVYSQVGHYLSHFSSGKVPKAFKIIPTLRNWEEIVFLTSPERWTPHAMYVATRLFASNLNPKMAQRFYSLVLLPRFRDNIAQYKKLNYHLYQSVRKAIYKPAAFFKGLLLPLAEYGCTPREAMIMSSILQKSTIPAQHAAAALLKLAEMQYSGPCVLFMKTLLDKKYSLPYRVVDALCEYFCEFKNDRRQMPVLWHQNLLVFVQRFKNELLPKQKAQIKLLLRKQIHRTITPEVRRELFAIADTTFLNPHGRRRTMINRPFAPPSASSSSSSSRFGGRFGGGLNL